jgi:RNA polymerase sigma-70 factor, ECF subfamily
MIDDLGRSVMESHGRLSETELPALMVRYQQGEADAVEALVRQLSPSLLRFLTRSGWTADAEDLLQECWIRIHRSRHTYRPSEPLLPWVFAVARHTRLDAYRKRRRQGNREILMAEPPDHLPANGDGSSADEGKFERLMEMLPEHQREVLVMLKVTGMSLEEVARATSSTVGAIKQKAHRAYAKLRLVLKEGGIDNGN